MTSPTNKPNSGSERRRVYDSPTVCAEYERQARELGQSDPAGDEVMRWIEAFRDWPTDEWPEYAEENK